MFKALRNGLLAVALTLALWPASQAVELERLQRLRSDDNAALAFQPGSDQLAIFSGNDELTIWNWKSGQRVTKLALPAGAAGILVKQEIAFSPDGNFIAACHTRGKSNTVLRMWRTSDWTVANELADTLRGTGCAGLMFSPDSSRLLLLSNRSVFDHADTIRSLEIATFKQAWAISSGPLQPKLIQPSPDGKTLAVVGNLVNVFFWNGPGPRPGFGDPQLENGGYLLVIDAISGRIDKTVALSQAPTWLSALSWKPRSAVVTLALGLGMENIDTDSGQRSTLTPPSDLNIGTTLDYSSDGMLLVEAITSSKRSSLKLWDGEHKQVLYQDTSAITCAAFSPDGRFLALGDDTAVTVLRVVR